MPGIFERHRGEVIAVYFSLGIYCGAINQVKGMRFLSSFFVWQFLQALLHVIDRNSVAGSFFLLGWSFGYFGAWAKNLIINDNVVSNTLPNP